MDNAKLITNSGQDFKFTPDANANMSDSAQHTFDKYNSYTNIANSGNGRIGGSDGGSGTLTDQDHPKFTETHVYKRRWWILLMLCLSVMQNSNNWITFSVCYEETHKEYGWDKLQVDWLIAWGPLLFIPTAIFLPYLNKIFTFRALMTISNLLMCIGAVIRSFPPDRISPHRDSHGHYSINVLILAHIGQILNAIAAPMVYAIPQQLSAIWFPKEQRTTATSIAVVSGYAGSLISYLTIYYIHYNKSHLLNVLRLEALFGLIFFIIVLSDQIWYDDIPPIPPSVSSMLSLERYTYSQQGYTFRNELKLIIKNRKFHYFTFICGAYQGVISGWTGILDVIFGPDYIGFKETYVALIGISTILAIIISGIIFGCINDYLHKRTKLIILVLLLISGVFLTLFTIVVNGGKSDFIAKNSTSQWVAIIFCVIGIFCNAGTYGLSYEASVELIYPSREVFAGTILCIYFNMFSSIFILLNNYLNPLLMNWIVAIIQLIACGLLIFYNQEYKRSDFDDAAMRSKILKTPTGASYGGSYGTSYTVNTNTRHSNYKKSKSKRRKHRNYTETPPSIEYGNNNNNSNANNNHNSNNRIYHSNKTLNANEDTPDTVGIKNVDDSLHSSI